LNRESVFEEFASYYDAWYERLPGSALFELEVACLRPLVSRLPSPRVEIGVGSGRFATALGIEVGVDVAIAPLRIARERAIAAVLGDAAALPFPDHIFGVVALVITLCFVDDPGAVLKEARRVVLPHGFLVSGAVPLDSEWGRHYQEEGRHGHPFYRSAKFFTLAEYYAMIESAGFIVIDARSTLIQPPTDRPRKEEVQLGAVQGAGFVALLAKPSVSEA
jgi:SAM-dependent methyltransferase